MVIFTNNYIRFSYEDVVLKVWDDKTEKLVKASGWGYIAKQCFTPGYIYEAVKGLDKLGCMGVTLCFYTRRDNKPAPFGNKSKNKGYLINNIPSTKNRISDMLVLI
ncbi:MAG: hypothetical protein NYU05_01510 [Aigarchaeota archaeon]|nr:hypothetical protein [Candidatus Caldarchaeales archaeon]